MPDFTIAIDGPAGAGKSTVAVSYTHLDVYKRQIQEISQKPLPQGQMWLWWEVYLLVQKRVLEM